MHMPYITHATFLYLMHTFYDTTSSSNLVHKLSSSSSFSSLKLSNRFDSPPFATTSSLLLLLPGTLVSTVPFEVFPALKCEGVNNVSRVGICCF